MYSLIIPNKQATFQKVASREKTETSGSAFSENRQTAKEATNQTRKGARKMKNYKITVDGYTIGVIELTAQEAQELEKDSDITVERI